MDKIRFGKYGVVFYCSIGVPRKCTGIAYGPIVFILPEHIDDRGLLEHELVHTRQFWNPLKWFKGKLWWEVEAFKEQAKWYSDDRSYAFAQLISTAYALDISVEKAEKLLGETGASDLCRMAHGGCRGQANPGRRAWIRSD